MSQGMPAQPGVGSALGAAVRYAWDSFVAAWGRLVGVYAIAYGAVAVLVFPLWLTMLLTMIRWSEQHARGGPVPDHPPLWIFGAFAVIYPAIMVWTLLVQLWTTRLGLDVTAGRPVTVGRFFSLRGLGRPAWAAVVVGLATGVGMLLCYLPGVVIAVLTMFVVPLVMDRGLSLSAAMAESSRLVRAHLGGSLLFALTAGGILMLGSMAVVGLLVAAPVAAIVQGCLYREVTRRG